MRITKEISIGDLFKELGIDEQGEYKAPKSLKIKTTEGFKKVNGLLKTQENPEWEIKTISGRKAIFTDKHKLEVKKSNIKDVNRYWKNLEDIEIGEEVNTEDGWEKVIKCEFNGKYSKMYDMEVKDVKSFYGNGFNSHNTAILGNFAINSFLEGKKVLVYTFETSDRRLLSRYYTNLINKTKKEIILDDGSAIQDLQSVLNQTDGDIIIKEYNANTVSSSDLMAHISDLKMYKNWVPDIVIADYILIMNTNDRRLNPENSYKYYKTVTEELRNIGKTLDVPIISATQINRQGQDAKGGSKAITTSKDMSESRGIYDTVDFFATINQTAADRKNGIVRLYIDKNRNGKKDDVIKLNIDYEHMRFNE